MISVIVIDDEPRARETIINILSLSKLDINIVGEAESVEEGFDKIVAFSPDLVLLDINLSDGSGFDLLKKFEQLSFKLIFITAHEEHAVRAFKYSAIDYILKPVKASDLLLAVEKGAQSVIKEENELKIAAFMENLKKIKKLVLKTAESIHIINISEIIRCEADVNYTRFFLLNHDQLLVSKTLKEYAGLLETAGFYRTHQSHLVNLEHVSRYDKIDGGHLVMADESIVPVSTRKKEELFRVFESL